MDTYNPNPPKKTYTGIDLFKLIAAILVVWLHATETTHPVAVGIQFTCTRFCVPFFFICSGYFFYSGLIRAEDSRQYFLNYEKRLLTLFLFYGVIISGPIAIRDYIMNNPDAGTLRLMLLIIRRVFIIGNGAYWYLVALIITTVFFYVCWVKNWNRFLVFVMITGQLLQTGYSSFQGLVSAIPGWAQINKLFYFVFSWDANFIMTGIPLFGIGWMIKKYNVDISKTTACVGFGVFSSIRIVEFLLPRVTGSPFWVENAFSLAYIPQAVMFFFWGCHCEGMKKYARTMRQLSTFIYFTHWIILYNILNPIMLHCGIDVYNPWFIPVKVAATLTVCLGLDWLLKKANNKRVYFLIGG